MISLFSTIACTVTLIVSLALPLLLPILFAIRYRKEGIFSAWLLGAAGFVVTQMFLRIPVLNYLSAREGFEGFVTQHFILYSLILGFTAGLFELAGRTAVAQLMGRKLTYRRALAAGMGHGGIEAVLIVGLGYVNNLVLINLIRSGGFDAMIAQAAAAGTDVTQLYALRDTLVNTSGWMFLLAGLERVLAMIAHMAMSMLVCYGVYNDRPLPGMLICLCMHTVMDTICGLFSMLSSDMLGNRMSRTAAYIIIYAVLAAVAALSIWILKEIHDRWPAEEKEVEVRHL